MATNQLVERMRITSTGDVGIGTNSPLSVLEASVQAPGDLGPILTLTNPGGGSGSAAAIDFNTYNPTVANYQPSGRIQAADDGNYGNNFQFISNTRGAPNQAQRVLMDIDSSGTVVVADLDVRGQVFNTTGPVTVADLNVTGTLTKPGGGFHIDHPLDPKNKYLNHSFVESPDMKNFYDGIAVLDESGQATVTLPHWFDTVNEDFRYHLTPIGGPAPQLHLAEEIANRTFRIAGGSPRQRICWEVTGSRKDAWAKAHPLSVEEAKPAVERGRYLHPELFGADQALSIMAARLPNLARRAAEQSKRNGKSSAV